MGIDRKPELNQTVATQNFMKVLLTALILMSQLALAAPKTVADYFLSIPRQNFIEGTLPQLLEIIKRGEGGSVYDQKNGYMKMDGDGAQVSLQVVLFRYPDKKPLLAIAWGNLEEPDFTHLTLFHEINDRMVVTDRKIFPVGDSPSIRFELPRIGRTVVVKNPDLKTVSKWNWVNQNFIQINRERPISKKQLQPKFIVGKWIGSKLPQTPSQTEVFNQDGSWQLKLIDRNITGRWSLEGEILTTFIENDSLQSKRNGDRLHYTVTQLDENRLDYSDRNNKYSTLIVTECRREKCAP